MKRKQFCNRFPRSKIAACPFCGGLKLYVSGVLGSCLPPGHAFGCVRCNASGPYRKSIEGARAAWNKRPVTKRSPEGQAGK